MIRTRNNKAQPSTNKITSTKWGKEHNLKLQGLFLKRNIRGGVDSKKKSNLTTSKEFSVNTFPIGFTIIFHHSSELKPGSST